ncbi:MAG: hypothetical protein A2219_05530 [Elusimicrobia bacterium RIFOXYA2_FULL_50_26]|nr:MAG: hypothetical protein A2219_05530 [Elusimicrobia bacterium RIFOXYA2_FULL_50_26]OGS24409.1 MAG: hypothetical protein A2314_04235 [Elusimicrobia bacterium RIFOXYB2_FULL_50_12]
MAFEISKDQCAGCGVCESTCTKGAIVPEADKFTIVADKCSDCGDCADVCPVSCISGTKK